MGRQRQEAKSEAAVAKALEAALELFSKQGFRGSTMRQIADAAGLSVGNLYHHFPSKEAIFERLLEDYWQRLLDPELPLNKVFARARFPEDLEEMAAAAEQVVEDNLRYILLIYVDVIEFRGQHIHDFYQDMANRFQDVYGDRLAERRQRGELGDVDPTAAVMVASRWFLYFFTVEKCFGVPMHLGLSPQQAVDEFIRLIRYGLLPRNDPPPSPPHVPEAIMSHDHRPDPLLSVLLATLLALMALPALAQTSAGTLEAAAAAALPSVAQEEADDDTANDEMAAGDAVEETITVTARKREEDVQEVPVAVTVVTGEYLEDRAAQDISELQSDVPNLSIYAGRNQSTTLTAFMRGIGQADPLWGVDPGVGLYLDDVYIARPQGALLDVLDVERIEVLRGPQGTLYGKNTIGGAIKYVSRPPTDTPDGRLSITPGTDGNLDLKASISGPIVKGKLRGKVAFASLTHDGYGQNLFLNREVSDKDTTAFRIGLDWLPSNDVTVSFSFDRTEDSAEPKGLTRLEANPFCPLFLGAPCPPEDNIFDTRSGLEPLNSTESEGYAMTIQWDMAANWTFKSITAHRESDTLNNIDFDTTPAPITDVEATYFDEQDSQEFQFLYDGGGKLSGVFGLYYFDGLAGGLVRNNFLNLIFGTTDGDAKTESFAVFGDGSYLINDRLTFNFGLRLTEEEKTVRAFNAGYSDVTFSQITAVTADFNKSETFSSVSPRLGLDYRFNDDVMGYVSLSRGFKSGGFNVRAQATILPRTADPFEDEQLTVAEIGVKSVLADRSLIFNAALFYGDYTDVQVSTFTSFDSDGDGADDAFLGDFLNAGDATLSGLELEWDWASNTATWFGLSGNLSFLDSDAETLDQDGDGFVDTQVITNAPELTGALNANVDFPAFGGLITGSVGVAYRDDSTLTNEGNGVLPIVQPSYDLWNAWVSWLSGDAKWRVSINGKNLTDEEYLTNGYNIPVLGLLQGSYGQPRTVTATIAYKLF